MIYSHIKISFTTNLNLKKSRNYHPKQILHTLKSVKIKLKSPKTHCASAQSSRYLGAIIKEQQHQK